MLLPVPSSGEHTLRSTTGAVVQPSCEAAPSGSRRRASPRPHEQGWPSALASSLSLICLTRGLHRGTWLPPRDGLDLPATRPTARVRVAWRRQLAGLPGTVARRIHLNKPAMTVVPGGEAGTAAVLAHLRVRTATARQQLGTETDDGGVAWRTAQELAGWQRRLRLASSFMLGSVRQPADRGSDCWGVLAPRLMSWVAADQSRVNIRLTDRPASVPGPHPPLHRFFAQPDQPSRPRSAATVGGASITDQARAS